MLFMVPGDQSTQTVPPSSSESVPQGSPHHASGGRNRPTAQVSRLLVKQSGLAGLATFLVYLLSRNFSKAAE